MQSGRFQHSWGSWNVVQDAEFVPTGAAFKRVDF
jgi:hypothetical protein